MQVHAAVVALPEGRVRILDEQPAKTGATFTDICRDTFLARLCALVPAPRFNMTRYYGVLAARHRLRSAVMPTTDAPDPVPEQLALFETATRLEQHFVYSKRSDGTWISDTCDFRTPEHHARRRARAQRELAEAIVRYNLAQGIVSAYYGVTGSDPWAYDPRTDRHWHSGHRHWHRGRPPNDQGG